jgi:hypothetical protein
LFEESEPAPAYEGIVALPEVSPTTAELAVPELMTFAEEVPVAEDVSVEIRIASVDEDAPLMMSLFSVDESPDDEVALEPMMLAMWSVNEEVAFAEKQEWTEEPELLRFERKDGWLTKDDQMVDAASEEEDFGGPLRMFTLAGNEGDIEVFEAESLPVEADGTVDVVLLSDSAMDGEPVLTASDPLNEIMLTAAMGPSPWQNLDNPDDVNVDGLTTPFDALLIINRVNDGISLDALTAVQVDVFVDVNGDRSLDANDAIQVINALNQGEQAPIAADMASRLAPIWYDGNMDEAAGWQETIAAEEWDNAALTDESPSDSPPLMVARLVRDEEMVNVSSEVTEKPEVLEDDSLLFSEGVDWLLPELL